jgi:hypothetical protein
VNLNGIEWSVIEKVLILSLGNMVCPLMKEQRL